MNRSPDGEVQWWGHRAVFTDPRGKRHLDGGWKPPELGATWRF